MVSNPVVALKSFFFSCFDTQTGFIVTDFTGSESLIRFREVGGISSNGRRLLCMREVSGSIPGFSNFILFWFPDVL